MKAENPITAHPQKIATIGCGNMGSAFNTFEDHAVRSGIIHTFLSAHNKALELKND